MHDVTIEQIQETLPAFPAEVIEMWFLPYAQEDGWPPPVKRWDDLLLNRPLEYWRLLEWSEEELVLQFSLFDQRSIEAIDGLIQTNVYGVSNIYSSLRYTRERFERIIDYINENQALPLPLPLVLLRVGHFYEIADGNHRVAALLHLQKQTDKLWPTRCWIASPPIKSKKVLDFKF